MSEENIYIFKQKPQKRKIIVTLIISILLIASTYSYFYFEDYLPNFRSLNENQVSPAIVKISTLALIKNQAYQCTLEKPEENVIILRLDDIQAWAWKNSSQSIINEIISREIPITLGVVPEDLGKDKETLSYLKEIKDSELIEIAQHGYTHEENEFLYLNETQAVERIIAGRNILIKELGVYPTTFIPPYNEYSTATLLALEENNFYINSAKKETQIFSNTFAILGYTARTAEFNPERFVPVEEVVSNCRQSLEETGICVVMLHPQDYTINQSDIIHERKYSEFLRLLDELENLNVEFIKFNDLLSCNI